MDSRDADLLKEIDPTQLGHRIRAARVAKGWTQTELAGGDISVGYVSRIESGQRRPNSAVLTDLAARLGVPVDHLLRGVTAREYDEIKLALDYRRALPGVGPAPRGRGPGPGRPWTVPPSPRSRSWSYRGRFIIARALEGQGNLDDAILELEPLVAAKTGGVLRIRAAIAMCRCLREAGDLSAAIEVGERVVHDLEGSQLDSCDEAVQLAVTLAGAYYLRGDTGQAVRICPQGDREGRERWPRRPRAPRRTGTPASSSRSAASVADAVPLAERALALLAEGQDSRNLARLRSQLGTMQLELDTPDVASRRGSTSSRPHEEMVWSQRQHRRSRPQRPGARPRALPRRRHDPAEDMCAEISPDVPTSPRSWRLTPSRWPARWQRPAETWKARRRRTVRRCSCSQAQAPTATRHNCGSNSPTSSRTSATSEAAREAYRSAAASTGLRSRAKVRASVLQI